MTVLHRDARGLLEAEGNELISEDLTDGDPVAFRMRSLNETKGKLSVDMRVGGGWKELGFVGFKADERGRYNVEHRDALEVEVWSHLPGRGFEDPDYERIFAIRHDGVAFYKGDPVYGRNELRHPDGVYWCVQQGDGNFVGYRNLVPYDYATGSPVFNWFTIRDRLERVILLEVRVVDLERRVAALEGR